MAEMGHSARISASAQCRFSPNQDFSNVTAAAFDRAIRKKREENIRGFKWIHPPDDSA
jgi:hypothetical protein